MRVSLQLLSDQELARVHGATLAVLAKTGMRLDSPRMLAALRSAGAAVDESSNRVRFPERLVEGAIEGNRALLAAGRRLHLLNGVTSEKKGEGQILAKVSGGCEQYYDWNAGELREATAAELLRLVRLGELLPEVDFVGNPIVLRRDFSGALIEERMRRLETAALVVKNTRKVGSMEVWDPREIDLLVEIGTIARGSREAYEASPCLLTAKETISPLHLDAKAAEILLALAQRCLPCTVIPMPIAGMSAPVSPLGGVVLGNAEILGVMTAVRALHPQALVGAGAISGVLDMRGSTASFSAPEAILQDIALAEVHERLYGANFLVGTGYTDARVPSAQVLVEKSMKFLFTRLSGRTTYPVGLVNGGSAFSPEQALVDLEICRAIQGHCAPVASLAPVDEIVRLIDEVGIRGTFLQQDHTFAHFRENWLPELFDFSDAAGDLYDEAHRRVQQLLSGPDFWRIEPEKARAIDEVIVAAKRILT